MSATVFNKNKVDFTKQPMFFGESLNAQRFDTFRYPVFDKLTQTQLGDFWRPEEVSLQKDRSDYMDFREEQKFIFTANLKYQILLDSVQGRAPAMAFMPYCSLPELEGCMNAWQFFENIHSRSYSHIIRNIYNVPKDVFNTIHDTKEIVDMASSVGRYYDELHKVNCRKELGEDVNEKEHIKAIYMALHASYALEAFRFMVSFATSLAMVENKIFIGNGNIISLILQDELLHKGWTAYLINQVVKEDSRFAQVKSECEAEVYQLYLDVIREEKEWADYLFKMGPVIGLNATVLKDFVDYTAVSALKEIGIRYNSPAPKTTPIPWFNKHVDTSKKQTALQENESTNYVIGVMTDSIEYDELPNI